MPKLKTPKKMVLIAVKVPEEMYNMLLKHIEKDTHTTISELVRDALREWIERHSLYLKAQEKSEEAKEALKA
jgi:Arc/MetJ-type ribon-helix-helix transcriptional regulator